MLISKKNRIQILSYLFKEGVICAKKDYMCMKNLGTDAEENEVQVPNLEVVKLMTSLKSKGFVRESFNWQWYYWYLTNEGIEYLREYLHLPPEIVPATLKKQPVRPARPPNSFGADREGGRDGERRGMGRGRGPKDFGSGGGGGFNPNFRREGGGFGRGRSFGRDDGYRRGEGGFGRGGGGAPRGTE